MSKGDEYDNLIVTVFNIKVMVVNRSDGYF